MLGRGLKKWQVREYLIILKMIKLQKKNMNK